MFKKSGEAISPLALNLFKNVVGLTALMLTMPLLGLSFVPNANWTDFGILLLSGLIGIGIADTLFFGALNKLGASKVAIIDCLYSPFVVIAATIYLKEPSGKFIIIAVGLMMTSILLTAEKSEGKMNIRGFIEGVLSMALMAIGIVIAKPVLDVSEPVWTAGVRLAGGILFLVVRSLVSTNRREIFAVFKPGKHWKFALPSALIGAYLAMILWIVGMKYTQTNIASVLNQTSNIYIMIFAVIFFKEKLTFRKILALSAGALAAILVVI